MPRPLGHGPQWDTKDARTLAKILERVTTDDDKTMDKKEQIETHLRAAISLLLGSTPPAVVRRTGTR